MSAALLAPRPAAVLLHVLRPEARRAGRLVTWVLVEVRLAVGALRADGGLDLVNTATGQPWAGELTAEERAEALAGLEQERLMRAEAARRVTWMLLEATVAEAA